MFPEIPNSTALIAGLLSSTACPSDRGSSKKKSVEHLQNDADRGKGSTGRRNFASVTLNHVYTINLNYKDPVRTAQ